ncbi:MAG: threonine synthase [Candidatus Melainabacteria bacterium]|nr:threonine synthase [Candidatus Melainabacteria bacterium]
MAGILERYRPFYPFDDTFPIVSLEEGNTPLVPAPRVAAQLKVPGVSVYLKYEGLNPTGSFKDRGMTYAVSQAKAQNAQYLLCASTGNTSASAAAYGARAGIRTLVIIPEGKIALGKLSQALLYGATIVEITGNFDQALEIVRAVGEASQTVAVVNSINPYRLEGQKTGAFEVCDVLGRAPDYHVMPVGNAGNITAYWRGYKAYQQAGRIQQLPVMLGYQAVGAAPLVIGRPVPKPETVATAIRIGKPASWQGAEAARDESGGRIDYVADCEILSAYHFLARYEGIFCEPASAASVAGLFKAASQGAIAPNSTIVCVLTGNGLKDPDNAIAVGSQQASRETLPADLDTIRSFLGV